MPDKPLSDTEAYQRLVDAADALGTAQGATVRADTALRAARRALVMIQMGLVKAADDASPADGPPRPPA